MTLCSIAFSGSVNTDPQDERPSKEGAHNTHNRVMCPWEQVNVNFLRFLVKHTCVPCVQKWAECIELIPDVDRCSGGILHLPGFIVLVMSVCHICGLSLQATSHSKTYHDIGFISNGSSFFSKKKNQCGLYASISWSLPEQRSFLSLCALDQYTYTMKDHS